MQLWQKYRDHFPVTKNLLYLNHAAVAPLCRPAAEAMQRLAQDALDFGSEHYAGWMETYQGLRDSTARLIHADPSEIAIVKNTSEGIATVAMGLAWKPGDIVVAFQEEFPANFYPWKRLEASGIEVRWLSVTDELDRIDAACTGARMLAVSYVQYLSGHRVNLEAIGEICSRRGCLFLVDAIQGMGAFPIDVRAAKIDALAADGHKWLLGPEGCGVLYVRREVQDRIEPVEFGWTNVAQYFDYASRDMTLRPDAGRYECGTLNTIGCYGLRASIDFLLEVGIENVAPAVQALADRIHHGVAALGFETLGSRSPATGAGIVSFRMPGVESQSIVARLRQAKIVTASRQGWVRAAPHFYIAPEEIDGMLSELSPIGITSGAG
ncbi:MAG: aminotransferase class V-fold PLP-dependent enzyme [Acidobacteriota bacterium]|nr:aminotransferase class V-fold PLP-dependent enzyme [Acidobacteriota bacterium]